MTTNAFGLLHPGVKRAIWSMEWTELKWIQVEAIKAILQENKHLLICAQTAGGKTEAAFLPIISSIVDTQSNSIQVLYVGPLKALINLSLIHI